MIVLSGGYAPITPAHREGNVWRRYPHDEPAYWFISAGYTDLYVLDGLTHGPAHVPGLRYILQHAGRQTDQDHHEIRHGEVHDEVVGDGPHVLVAQHREAHQEVAGEAHDEHHGVEDDDHPLLGLRVDVVGHHVHVGLVTHAVVVVTYGGCGVKVIVQVAGVCHRHHFLHHQGYHTNIDNSTILRRASNNVAINNVLSGVAGV